MLYYIYIYIFFIIMLKLQTNGCLDFLLRVQTATEPTPLEVSNISKDPQI